MESQNKVCVRCIMDTTAQEIEFDENGVCCFCRDYEKRAKKYFYTRKKMEDNLNRIINKIKKDGKKQKYDCVIGVSGGTDSTYLAFFAKKLGLRPLCVHLDNGWDSKESIDNIRNIVEKLNLDFYNYVADWDEFKDLQLAYLKASVINFEVPTDQAIRSVLYRVANERHIGYILLGSNMATEGILPGSWGYNCNDLVNMKAIHDRFGKVKMKNYPSLGLFREIYFHYIKDIKLVALFNFIPYIKKEVQKIIAQELDWKDYGEKHFESVITRFYQGYILPQKFGVDIRKANLSSLICSGQLTREEAIKEMEKSIYKEELLKTDKEYVLRKLGLTENEFEKIMNTPPKSHYDYKSSDRLLRFFISIYRIFEKNYGNYPVSHPGRYSLGKTTEIRRM